MRILVALIIVFVFGAMLLIDPAALFRATTLCVTGGCGVSPWWIAIGCGVVTLAVWLSMRKRHTLGRSRSTKSRASPSPRRKQPGSRKKAKRTMLNPVTD